MYTPKKLLLTAAITAIFALNAAAQSVSGYVKDDQYLGLPEAYVYNSDLSSHCHTDTRGYFECADLSIGDTLVISFLGFRSINHIINETDFGHTMEFILKQSSIELGQLIISNSLKSPSQISAIDLFLNPVKSSQDILQKVPGLIIAQHAGGGKAEQIFLRGFDIDHGTDITISVDGLPVNMVSHAHGQGYADLHFVIPETIDKVDFGKGPYYADHGNFNTAGYVDFKLKETLEHSSAGIGIGDFQTFRNFLLLDLFKNEEGGGAYIAAEYLQTDGPVESPQNFNRINVLGKYTTVLENDDRIGLTVSTFKSKWDASGQIPKRLVDNGTISRFGYVDNTEGGYTGRTNVALDYTKNISQQSFVKTQAFYSTYDFELYSNFTFFLEDPINGDQIRQKENRSIIGMHSQFFHNSELAGQDLEWQMGMGLRYDDINNNELSQTVNRTQNLSSIQLGNVDESNLFAHIAVNYDLGPWRFNIGTRLDHLNFEYNDLLAMSYSTLSNATNIVSPKLNILFNPNKQIQIFLKSGKGFHSNDSRVVVAQNGVRTLPAAFGIDLGTIWKINNRLWTNATLWQLYLEQEFVYVGDAGIVEPSGRSSRKGLEVGFRYQLSDFLFASSDINYTYARAIDEEVGNNYIPLAPDLTAAGSLSLQHPSGVSGSIKYKYVKSRPANEDGSITALGYFITDATLNYTYKSIVFGLSVENIFNNEWNEAQFATNSKLRDEPTPVEELHFTPGTPRFLKARIQYNF